MTVAQRRAPTGSATRAATRTVTLTVRVDDPEGLHARPCARIAHAAERFRASVLVSHAGRTADARRVLELLGLGVLAAADVEIRAEGEDAAACAEAVARAVRTDR